MGKARCGFPCFAREAEAGAVTAQRCPISPHLASGVASRSARAIVDVMHASRPPPYQPTRTTTAEAELCAATRQVGALRQGYRDAGGDAIHNS